MSNKNYNSYNPNNDLSILRIHIDELPFVQQMLKNTIKDYGDYCLSYIDSDPILKSDLDNIVKLVVDVDRESRTNRYTEYQSGGTTDNGSLDMNMVDLRKIIGVLAYDRLIRLGIVQDIDIDKEKSRWEAIPSTDSNIDLTDISYDLVPNNMELNTLTYNLIPKTQNNKNNMRGGQLFSFGFNPLDISYTPSTCPEFNYPIRDRDDIPDPVDILKKIIPSSFTEQAEEVGETSVTYVKGSRDILENLNTALSVFDETQGNLATRIAKSTGKIAGSILGAVVTLGAGGDNVVSAPTVVAKGVALISKLVSKLSKITTRVKSAMMTLKRFTTTAQKAIDTAIPITEKAIRTSKIATRIAKGDIESEEIQRKIYSLQVQMLFLMDLFSTDFALWDQYYDDDGNPVFDEDGNPIDVKIMGGPAYVRCRTEYVMNGYLAEYDFEEMKEMLCLVNEIYTTIDGVLISFVGSVIDVAVPDTMGLVGTFLPQIINSATIYTEARNKTEGFWYQKIDRDIQDSFENPEYLKHMIAGKLSKYSIGLSDQIANIIPGKDKIGTLVDITAHAINKGLSLLFLFVNIFYIFSHLDPNISNVLAQDCPLIMEAVEKLKPSKETIEEIRKSGSVSGAAKKAGKITKTKASAKAKEELARQKEDIIRQRDERIAERESGEALARQKEELAQKEEEVRKQSQIRATKPEPPKLEPPKLEPAPKPTTKPELGKRPRSEQAEIPEEDPQPIRRKIPMKESISVEDLENEFIEILEQDFLEPDQSIEDLQDTFLSKSLRDIIAAHRGKTNIEPDIIQKIIVHNSEAD